MSLLGWLRKPAPAVSATRWVMVDVETSGLNARSDRLLAIAAIGLRVDWAQKRLAIVPGDSFEVDLAQAEASSRSNILLHGIGAARQQAGADPAQAMQAFAAYVADAPLLAFHAWFDQRFVGRYAREHGVENFANPWVDVEHLCGMVHPEIKVRSLDDWMAFLGVKCAVRHQAAADTLAECEVLQRVWPRIAAQCDNWGDVQRLAARWRWAHSH